jgi:hypothetical protein
MSSFELFSSEPVTPQLDTDTPLSNANIAQAQPLGVTTGSGVTPHDIAPGLESSRQLADRGQPRDLDTWANQQGELSQLDNDASVWERNNQEREHKNQSVIQKVSHNIVQLPNAGTVALPNNIPPDMQTSTLGYLYSLWEKATSASAPSPDAIHPEAHYYFHPEVGLIPVNAHMPAPAAPAPRPAAPSTSMPALARRGALYKLQSEPVSPETHTVVAVPNVGMVAFPKEVPMPMVESTLGHLYSKLAGAATPGACELGHCGNIVEW